MIRMRREGSGHTEILQMLKSDRIQVCRTSSNLHSYEHSSNNLTGLAASALVALPVSPHISCLVRCTKWESLGSDDDGPRM